MATYYVKTGGNDLNLGTSEDQAWRTITKAVNMVSPGDVVYIAPGVYRESISMVTAGDTEAPIVFEGDPDCAHFNFERPGPVRITVAYEDETRSPGQESVVAFNGLTYITLKNVLIDGQMDESVLYGPTLWGVSEMGGGCTLENSIVFSPHAAVGGATSARVIRCALFSGYKGAMDVTVEKSLVIAPTAVDGCAVTCSILMRGTQHLRDSANNLIIGGEPAISLSSGQKLWNSIIMGAYQAFTGAGESDPNTYLVNCLIYACYKAVTGTSTMYGTVDCIHNYLFKYGLYGSTQGKHSGYTSFEHFRDLLFALRPAFINDFDRGTDLSEEVDPSLLELDALDQPRIGRETPDIGPIENTHVEIDWDNYYSVPPGIRIWRRGAYTLRVPVVKGRALYFQIWVRSSLEPGDPPPKVVIRGKDIHEEVSGTGSSTWEQITIPDVGGGSPMLTPEEDQVLHFELINMSNSPGTYVIFSDPIVRY